MSKILFDKKRKTGIIHHARQRTAQKPAADIEIHHFIYFPTPLYTKTRCQAGFCVCWGFFYLFETIGRRGVSQSKCPEGGTRLPSGSWAGDGMPCNGNDRRQWRIQGVAVGAAASKTQATRSGCWEPQPEFASGEQMLKLNILQNSAGPRF